MATIRRLRGKWQTQVRRKGLPPKAKSFASKVDAEKWAHSLEAEIDRAGVLPDTRLAEQMTVRELLDRYLCEITPHKQSASTETYRIKALMQRDIAHRTLAMLSSADVAAYRDARLLESNSARLSGRSRRARATQTNWRREERNSHEQLAGDQPAGAAALSHRRLVDRSLSRSRYLGADDSSEQP